MSNENSSSQIVYGTGRVGETNADYRTRMASLRAEALEHWQKQLAEPV
jgi:hypothetical protein